MKLYSFILLILVFSACQSTKIKDNKYKVATNSPELGSIGYASLKSDAKNLFNVKTLPRLDNPVRVDLEAVPFNHRLHKVYKKKEKYNQKQLKLNYADSLPQKPELIMMRLLDMVGFVRELNADYNADVFRLIKNTQDFQIVTSVAAYLPEDEIMKIRQADAYYLTNSQDSKYVVSLYKSGKRTESISIKPQNILAYRLSSICWGITEKGQYYIADIVESGGCKGNSTSKVSINKKKKQKSLYDM